MATVKGTAAASKKANAGVGNFPVSKKISGGSSVSYPSIPGPKQPSAADGAAAVSGKMGSGGNSKMVSHMNGTTQCMQMTPEQTRKNQSSK